MEIQKLFGYDRLQDQIVELRSFIASEFGRLFVKIESLEKRTMATLSQVLEAVQTNGVLIAEATNALIDDGIKIQALIDQIKSNGGESPELTQILDLVQTQGSQLAKLKDTALQLVPTIPSPEIPTEPGVPTEPIPTPEPLPPVTDTGDGISISPTDDGTGLPGSVDISVS